MASTSSTRPSVPRLLVTKGADEGKQFDLTDPQVSVGRESSNRIRLHDTEVSRRHAEFRQVDGEFLVIDVGSANGTYVNNTKVKQATLRTGPTRHCPTTTWPSASA